MSVSVFKNIPKLIPIKDQQSVKYVTVQYTSGTSKKPTQLSFPILGMQIKHTSDISIQKTLSNGLIVSDFGVNPSTIVLSGIAQGAAVQKDTTTDNILIEKLIKVYNEWLKNRTKLITISVGRQQYKGIVLSLGYRSYKQYQNVVVFSISFLGYDING